ncbi:MAG: hypothetical protein H3C64_02580 [Candidatus Kuenenia stuttgartiensis]|uniref:hypothetical protein n=1 Tax=Candidatus Kuenenia TaxID=380738 RepID=UPI0002F7546A|nr:MULTISPECIES: hypothetical protein [Kuenenia]MBE7546655.1 hypothetical protein [Planctomycetia bacterium]MBW7941288.1 hypothetical protein [Candidatus Kuenenia stuttgartiensis]MBZ0190458.1 hypothetical protein [Candidatus Kuenenia stuttgartiensis]MCF6152759.1 hypothetical protein [Candidatus Kuenenia stuttgartiensis]MCZ7623974.1 hypothetical protein [Candidatus Kuenenia sp.]
MRSVFDEKQAARIAEAIETALETSHAALLEEVATKKDLAEAKAEIIKWMFIFWIGQFASVVGVLTAILFAFFRK